ncbi:MAG: amidohydrolase family protein [Burkholderiaceae bacterium]|jgi:cytosine/adenosine deaminase-related metal-dependent hydrolase
MKQTLIKGGLVVTMDATLGDLAQGDVLVEGDRIVSVGRSLAAPGAQVVNAGGMIVAPGLVNAHMHTWQTGLRGVAANWTILEYFKKMHAGLATLFSPEDIRIANLVGALNQINCGTTTLADWCHNNPTPAHTDAAIDGLAESQIRAVFFHGSPKPDPKPGQKPFWEVPHPRSEVERLLKTRFSSRDQLMTLGLAILGPHYSTYDVAVDDFKLAREFGLIASMHCAGAAARVPDGWDRLGQAGLLGDNNNIVHGNDLTDAQLKFMLDRGVSFSLTPETEMFQGHGFAITGRLRDLGAQPSLGVDLESCISGDMFTVARMALASQKAFDNARAKARDGKLPDTGTITAREALGWITVEGARMLKMQDRIGSLTPGKQADLIMVRATDLNMQPMHDPVATLVTQASLANIDSVMIAGEFRKRDGRMAFGALADRQQQLVVSGQRIMRELDARLQAAAH